MTLHCIQTNWKKENFRIYNLVYFLMKAYLDVWLLAAKYIFMKQFNNKIGRKAQVLQFQFANRPSLRGNRLQLFLHEFPNHLSFGIIQLGVLAGQSGTMFGLFCFVS